MGVITQLADAFKAHGKTLYLVGGTVRDEFLGRPSHDIDCTTDALPEEIKQIAATTHPLRIFPIGEKFGTIQVQYDEPSSIEITTYRGERYTPGSRKPEVQFGTSLIEDLRRRDFTINAIAKDALNGTIIDPFHGQADLSNGYLRAVDNPVQRFADDPLRLLRAARFVAQFNLHIAGDTYFAMKQQAARLREISQERIRDELCKMLVLPEGDNGLWAMLDTLLLEVCLPEVAALVGVGQYPHHRFDVFGHTRLVIYRSPKRLTVRLAALLHDIAKPQTRTVDERGITRFYKHEDIGADMARDILRRLRFGNDIVEHVAKVVRLHMRVNAYTSTWSRGGVRRLYIDAGNALEDTLDLAIADGTSDRDEPAEVVKERIAELRMRLAQVGHEVVQQPIISPLNGDELMAAFGRGPGPWLRPVKQHLHDLVIEGTLNVEDKDKAVKAAKAFLETQK